MDRDDPQPPNRPAGAPPTPGHDPASEPVATGDRREELHYEPDPNQLVRMRATYRPGAPIPAHEQSHSVESGRAPASGPPVEDVAIMAQTPSVWDARPPDEEPEAS